jgi:hypothetical protein
MHTLLDYRTDVCRAASAVTMSTPQPHRVICPNHIVSYAPTTSCHMPQPHRVICPNHIVSYALRLQEDCQVNICSSFAWETTPEGVARAQMIRARADVCGERLPAGWKERAQKTKKHCELFHARRLPRMGKSTK